MLLVISCFLATSAVFLGIVQAATTGTVTATITAQNVSIQVTDGSIGYGTRVLSATRSTLPSEANDMQTATNNGNITEDFNIKGQDSAAWTLAGTQGANQYFHKFCNDTDDDCTTPPTSYTAMTTSYQALDTGITASGTVDFQLQVGLPSSTASYTEQSVDVIVQAVAP